MEERNNSWRDFLAVLILFFVNLLNYMDRFTVSAVLAGENGIQKWFAISDSESGLLQTVFICVHLVTAPLFGYLGDRYSRRFLLAIGVAIWSTAVLASTFIPQNMFWLFLLLRAVVGIGEATHAVVAPTIIADLFEGHLRAQMFMIFALAAPIGAGLGFVVGGGVAAATGQWQWGLRVTPLCDGYVSVLLILFVLKVPARGGHAVLIEDMLVADGVPEVGQVQELQATSWFTDVRELLGIKSYVLVACAQICQYFAIGALIFWAPVYTTRAMTVIHGTLTDDEVGEITMTIGAVVSVGGLVGIIFGTLGASYWHVHNEEAEALVSGLGLIVAAVTTHVCLVLTLFHLDLAYAFLFLTDFGFALNWALVINIIMSVTHPRRRGTAIAVQVLVLNLFGAAASPTIIGKVSDAFRQGSERPLAKYESLQQALFVCEFVAVIGGFFFLVCSWYIVEDRARLRASTQLKTQSEKSALLGAEAD